jgi:hypothetical protein
MVKIRDNGHIQNKAIHVCIGVNMEGNKEVLGLWAAQNEGAKFWLQVLTELQSRGVKDVFIVCVDGLKGFPEAIEAIYPKAEVQLCIVHLIRASLNYVPWTRRKQVAADLRAIYQAATAAEAELQLDIFAAKWDASFPMVSQVVAAQLGPGDALLGLSGGDPEGDLHHQCRGSSEPVVAENHQNARRFSQRRCRAQAVVFGAAAGRKEIDDADP